MGNQRRWMGSIPGLAGRSRGQVLVLVAFSMIGLLVAAGLATDVGIIMMRKAQFDRAVDAAALAGAPKARTSLTTANQRGMAAIAANGIGLIGGTSGTGDCDVWAATDGYCGHVSNGTLPGAKRYKVQARMRVNMAFMNIIGITYYDLTSSAEAEYFDTVDTFTSGNPQGLVQTSNLELFGPRACTGGGDPNTLLDRDNDGSDAYTPNRFYRDLYGVYTYRIAIPKDYQDTYDNIRVEILDPQTGNPNNTSANPIDRIYQPSGKFKCRSGTCGSNPPYGVTGWQGPNNSAFACDNTRGDPCLLETDLYKNNTGYQQNIPGTWTEGYTDSPNYYYRDDDFPMWFMRMDELRNCGGLSYTNANTDWNTETLFRLYYFTQDVSTGALVPVDLAYYLGKKDDADQPRPSLSWAAGTDLDGNSFPAGSWQSVRTGAQAAAEAQATMLKWISPGAPASEQMPAYTAGALVNGVQNLINSVAEPQTWTEDCDLARQIRISWPAGLAGFPITGYPVSKATYCAPNTTNPSGNSDFTVNLDDEAPDIYEDPNTGVRYLYLDVRGISGASENNFALWAGPSRGDDPQVDAPAEVNARQLFILRQNVATTPINNNTHASRGLVVYGTGHLPLNSDVAYRVRFPVAYLGPEFSGLTMHIRLFDADSGARRPVIFYFDTIPQNTWQACFAASVADCGTDQGGSTTRIVNNYFGDAPGTEGSPPSITNSNYWGDLTFNIPSESSNPATSVPFYGGRLFAYYQGGGQDTYGWTITVDARPAITQ